MRRSLSTAIDRDALVLGALQGNGHPAPNQIYGVVPQGALQDEPAGDDPAATRALLADEETKTVEGGERDVRYGVNEVRGLLVDPSVAPACSSGSFTEPRLRSRGRECLDGVAKWPCRQQESQYQTEHSRRKPKCKEHIRYCTTEHVAQHRHGLRWH